MSAGKKRVELHISEVWSAAEVGPVSGRDGDIGAVKRQQQGLRIRHCQNQVREVEGPPSAGTGRRSGSVSNRGGVGTVFERGGYSPGLVSAGTVWDYYRRGRRIVRRVVQATPLPLLISGARSGTGGDDRAGMTSAAAATRLMTAGMAGRRSNRTIMSRACP